MKTRVVAFLTCIFAAGAILFAAGCEEVENQLKQNLGDDTDVSISDDDVPPDEVNTGTVVISDADGDWGTDDFVLNDAEISDDTLRLNVSYGGGCETHQFTLVTSGVFMESFPVQLAITIAHNANNDPCEAFLTDDYHFDLTAIKALFQDGYKQEAGAIILLLDDAPDGQLVYQFAM